MNQQRSRRFRASQEAQEKAEQEERITREWEANHGTTMPAPWKSDATGTDQQQTQNHFDSNCITPGTPFMSRLADALRYYAVARLNTDPGWTGGLKVFISDASVPGEGEHKIMDYIRRQRVQPEYDADTNHVLYGLDADLIMLAVE